MHDPHPYYDSHDFENGAHHYKFVVDRSEPQVPGRSRDCGKDLDDLTSPYRAQRGKTQQNHQRNRNRGATHPRKSRAKSHHRTDTSQQQQLPASAILKKKQFAPAFCKKGIDACKNNN